VLKYFLFIFFSLPIFSGYGEKAELFLPGDLTAEVWAESPMFYNPTNMDVDAKGRVWVTEAVNYRNFNNDSGKTLHHSRGDRVVILEDTDQDGKADKSTVFVQDRDLVSPVGIAVIGNQVIVSCSPNLIIYTDDNGDDVPDKKEILLKGFGGLDHDHSLHAVYAGPDGQWYFNTGNAGPHVVTDRAGWTLRSGSIYTGGTPYNITNQGNMKSDDGKVWVGGLALRMDKEGRGLKVMGHNFRNSYEVIPDSYGQLWQNDNDDQVVTCRATWLMEGGNAGFFSTDGSRYWQADQRPGQGIFQAHWHQEDPGVMPAGHNTGSGAPTGVTVIETDALGKQYLGMFLSADAGRNTIFGFLPAIQRSGFDLGKRMNIVTSLKEDNERYVWNDTSFNRKKEMWFRPSDVTVGTDGSLFVADWYDPVVGGHQMKDSKGYGRIYRISPKNKKLKRPVYDMATTEGQIDALMSPAINVRNLGFERLLKKGESATGPVGELLNNENRYIRARAVWLLSQLGAGGIEKVRGLLHHNDEQMRAVAYKALLKSSKDSLSLAAEMVNDQSPFVRREVAASLRDIDPQGSRPLLIQLMKNYKAGDRWYLETLGAAMDKEAESYYAEAKKILALGNGPLEWNAEMSDLAWRLHPLSALQDLKARASSSQLASDQRSAALTAISFINHPQAVQAMLDLSKAPLKDVAEQSTYWLSFRQSNDWFSLMDWSKVDLNTAYQRKLARMKVNRGIILDEHQSADERKGKIREMAADSLGGQMLISMAEEKLLTPELTKYVGDRIFNNPDVVVRVQAGKYFKKPGNEVQYSIEKIAGMRGDGNKGKLVFTTYCGSCHQKDGIGKSIGPELTGIRNKFDKIAMMDAIINPSAAIVFGYEPWLISMKGGESLYGFIVSENTNALVLKDVSGTSHHVAVDKISKKEKQQGSLMPDPATNKMTDQQLADVTAWLMK
jgi:putative membrane-bound dehydrogenase-like protein